MFIPVVAYVYSCLFTGIILVQIHTGILTWNGTGIIMNIHEFSSLFMFLEFQESMAAINKGAVQTAKMRRLICTFVVQHFCCSHML